MNPRGKEHIQRRMAKIAREAKTITCEEQLAEPRRLSIEKRRILSNFKSNGLLIDKETRFDTLCL